MNKLKIVIAHQDHTLLNEMGKVVALNPAHHVVGMTSTEMNLERIVKQYNPDLVILDLFLTSGSISQLTRFLKQECHADVILIAPDVTKYATLVSEAMQCGAADVVKSPDIRLIEDVREFQILLRKINLISLLRGKGEEGPPPIPVDSPSLDSFPLILIGASTGGPLALSTLLSFIPETIQASFVIVQHVDEKFSLGLAEWLTMRSPLPVKVIEEGKRPLIGTVHLAGSNQHLVLSSYKTFSYCSQPKQTPYRPSIDVFFESVAKNWPGKSVAVLLTGMGRDGAEGLKLLKDKGWLTYAEHQSSCVVYGMPKAAVEIGAVTESLPLEQISKKIVRYVDGINPAVKST